MRIAICDDEIKYINEIELHLNQYAREHGLSFEVFKYNDGFTLLNDDIEFDIIFLDIEMPNINGIKLGERLRKTNQNAILIYITAYNHYLDDALDLGITRFFDKPIDSRRFYRGLEKAIQKIDQTDIKIHLKDFDNGFITIKMNDIIFVEIIERKIKIVTNDRIYYSSKNIKYWREKLSKSYFESPHKSFIINTNYVTYFCKDYITLNKKYNIPIAYKKRAEIRKKFMLRMEN